MGLFRPVEPKVIRISDADPRKLDFLCWRVTRSIALAKGLLGPEEMLLDLYRRDPDWAAEAQSLAYPDGPIEMACQDIPATPSPETAHGFAVASKQIVNFIRENIDETSAVIVSSPEVVYDAWPTANELIEVEYDLVQQAYRALVGSGSMGRFQLHGELIEKLSYAEADGILRMVYNLLATVSLADMEQERAMLISRFDDLARRAAEQNNLTAETNALRSIAILLGVSKSEPVNEMKEISSVIENYSKQIPSTSTRRPVLPRGGDDGVQ